MKTITTLSAIALSTAMTTAAYASPTKEERANDARHISTFFATTIAGAVAGGPIGMFIGALGGGLIIEKNQKTFEERNALSEEVDQLSHDVTIKDLAIVNLENRVAQKLEFQVMFPTGEDMLGFNDAQRIRSLANYLNNNPELNVRLDGHADPRGTDEYNNVLSSERAKSVADLLVKQGIAKERINIHAHGSRLAVTTDRDLDQYAMERRVHIEVLKEGSNIASNP